MLTDARLVYEFLVYMYIHSSSSILPFFHSVNWWADRVIIIEISMALESIWVCRPLSSLFINSYYVAKDGKFLILSFAA